jgi:hypothetical protein
MNKFLATAAIVLALATPAFATDDDCEINLDQYNQVKVGMRMPQVVEAFGCDGIRTFSAKSAGGKTETYNWEGAHVIFSNGSVYAKGQHGLVPAGETKPVQKPLVINVIINDDTGKVTVVAPKADPAAIGQKAIDAIPQQ